MSLRLAGIHHSYGARPVLRSVDLEVGAGETVCLLGPSGDGKTTLLRVISGLEPVQAGSVEIGGALVAAPGSEMPPEARRVGFVFQDYALFPHLDVAANVGFGLRHLPAAERRDRVAEALDRVKMTSFATAWPHTLSGGQQQRIALARALAPRPAVLLLDEAFASLDARLRAQVRDETLRVLQQAQVATLIVTHDAEEAMAMADRIALMRDGQIVQQGAPEDLYLRPANRFVAEFLGEVNHLPATVRAGTASTALGPLAAAGLPDGPAEALVRPEAIRLLDPHAAVGAPAEIAACRSLGPAMLVRLALAGEAGHLQARLPPGPPWPRGGAVRVAVDPERAYVFPAAVS